MLLLIFIVLSLAIGYIRGGRLRNISEVRFNYGILILIAFVVKLVLVISGFRFEAASPRLAVAAHIFTYFLVAAFLILNWQIAGMRIIAAGLMLNFFTIMADGSFELSQIGYATAADSLNLAISNQASKISLLPFRDVFNLGSLLMALGVFAVVSRLMQIKKAIIEPDIRNKTARPRYQPKHLARPRKWSVVIIKKAV
ncbi:MAG: DUF5317 family protein [Firmicutes bacterium]|nr:DUF5317 family protein [Bacillota bacterium]